MTESPTDTNTDTDTPQRGEELFSRIGATKLRAVVADFYDRVFDDVMIGFMFQGANKSHLIERETELAARFLGAPGITYKGRSMREAHAKHTIFGGHFERRLQILRETLADHAVDAEVQRVWIDHTLALSEQITRDKGSECKTTTEADAEAALAAREADANKPIKLGRRR